MESVTFAETIGKLCFDCKTSKTPLWRSGPAGPKSLCNACGIRFRKKKSVSGGSDKKKEKHQYRLSPSPSQSPSPTSSATEENTSVSSRKRDIGDDVSMEKEDLRKRSRIKMLQRPRSPMKKVRNEYMMKKIKFGEVEEAAYLLMSLSCG